MSKNNFDGLPHALSGNDPFVVKDWVPASVLSCIGTEEKSFNDGSQPFLEITNVERYKSKSSMSEELVSTSICFPPKNINYPSIVGSKALNECLAYS